MESVGCPTQISTLQALLLLLVLYIRDGDLVHCERLYTSVLTGKELATLFYTKPHEKSYYLGCSLGGRQGIQAAVMFPRDFDGIVAGSPALDFNNLASWRASFFPISGSVNSPDFIAAWTWTSLTHDEVLNQCDGLMELWMASSRILICAIFARKH